MATNFKSRIPKGCYCYDENGICPFWCREPTQQPQEDGYCSYLGKGDWQLSCGLLWDQVKECGVNDDENEAIASNGCSD